jgi:regulator of sigma E protease
VAYLLGIVALGVLVALHEMGHLLAARAFRIRVLRYSIGFGPPIFTWKRGETAYTLGAVPLGGFVRILGMSAQEEGVNPRDPRTFVAQRPWKRILVLAAGSVLNYLLALVLLWGLYLTGTHVAEPLTIGQVDPGSEAARVQLRPGDRVVFIDGAPARTWSDLVERVNDAPGEPLRIAILRGADTREMTVVPRADEDGVGHIGVAQQYVYRELGPVAAGVQAVQHANLLVSDGVRLLARLVRGRRGASLSTPIGIVKQASDAAASGADAFLRMLASISVALAIFNLLPVPALDGGRILFSAFEALTGKSVSSELETVIHAVGFIALLVLLAFVAFRDVRGLLAHRTRAPAAQVDAGS